MQPHALQSLGGTVDTLLEIFASNYLSLLASGTLGSSLSRRCECTTSGRCKRAEARMPRVL